MTKDQDTLTTVLGQHEVVSTHTFVVKHTTSWETVAICACGFSGPLQHRASHLARVLTDAARLARALEHALIAKELLAKDRETAKAGERHPASDVPTGERKVDMTLTEERGDR